MNIEDLCHEYGTGAVLEAIQLICDRQPHMGDQVKPDATRRTV